MQTCTKPLVLTILLIILVSGCDATAPAQSLPAVAQAHTTAPSIPPFLTPTPLPPTATGISPTLTRIPKGDSPTPTLPTEINLPGATSTPSPLPWPTAEAFFEGVRITFFNNAGFMIVVGDTKIFVDLLYDNYPLHTAPDRAVLQRAVTAQPPFDQADLILATHYHGDHFSADLVRDYLRSSPETVFVSSPQAVRQINNRGAEFKDRLIAVSLDPGESSQLSVKDIELSCFYISHGDGAVLNIGFAITVDQVTFFHSGDMYADSHADAAVSLADLQAYRLPQMGIDVAFLPSYVFLYEENRPLITEGIQAHYLVPMHFPLQNPPSEIEELYSNAVVFKDTMESWVLPLSADQNQLGDTQIRTQDGMHMLYVPAGQFEMGTSQAELDLLMEACAETHGQGDSCQPEDYRSIGRKLQGIAAYAKIFPLRNFKACYFAQSECVKIKGVSILGFLSWKNVIKQVCVTGGSAIDLLPDSLFSIDRHLSRRWDFCLATSKRDRCDTVCSLCLASIIDDLGIYFRTYQFKPGSQGFLG